MGKGKVIRLRDKSPTTQYTPKEALERAIGLLSDDPENKTRVLILVDDPGYDDYQWVQGGGLSFGEMNWMADQFKLAILLSEAE